MKNMYALALWLAILIALVVTFFNLHRTTDLEDQLEKLRIKHETDMTTIRVAIERDINRLTSQMLREKAASQPGHPATPPAKSPEKR
jgi:hypothetical protein